MEMTEHTDIKKVANSHVLAILKRCQRGQIVIFFLLRYTFSHAVSQTR